jgi:hypothetical protein
MLINQVDEVAIDKKLRSNEIVTDKIAEMPMTLKIFNCITVWA